MELLGRYKTLIQRSAARAHSAWRVRGGFAGSMQARQFCGRARPEGLACRPPTSDPGKRPWADQVRRACCCGSRPVKNSSTASRFAGAMRAW